MVGLCSMRKGAWSVRHRVNKAMEAYFAILWSRAAELLGHQPGSTVEDVDIRRVPALTADVVLSALGKAEEFNARKLMAQMTPHR